MTILGLVQLFGYAAYAQGGPAFADHSVRPGEFIVELSPAVDVDTMARDSRLQGLQLRKGRLLSRHLNIWLMHYVPAPNKASEELATVKSHPDVLNAQFNHRVTLRGAPSDPLFVDQWALHNTGQSGGTEDADIDALEAWDITEGGLSADGDEIVVAVIDGGFDLNHDDIDYWKNSKDPVGDDNDLCEGSIDPVTQAPYHDQDDDCNGYIDDYDGWDAYLGINITTSTNALGAHGTHVTGIAAAIGNNDDPSPPIGVSGVNQRARVVPIVAYSGGGAVYEADVITAYDYVVTLRKRFNETGGAEGAYIVVSNSSFGVEYGDPDYHYAWCEMYDVMGREGILSVAAVDWRDHDVDTMYGIPDSCGSEYLITVTSTDRNDEKDRDVDGFGDDLGAAWGATHVDLGAPGKDIISTLPYDSYGEMSGPSMAAPHVAGAVALMHSAAPLNLVLTHKDYPLGDELTLQLKRALLDTVDTIPELNAAEGGIHPTVAGGRLNVRKAVEAMTDFDSDGIIDSQDNCSEAVNPLQDDTDSDDCGNICDTDYDDSGVVGFADFGQLVGAFLTSDEEKCHVEPIPGCVVGFDDYGAFVQLFGTTPGPSGTTAGTTACP